MSLPLREPKYPVWGFNRPNPDLVKVVIDLRPPPTLPSSSASSPPSSAKVDVDVDGREKSGQAADVAEVEEKTGRAANVAEVEEKTGRAANVAEVEEKSGEAAPLVEANKQKEESPTFPSDNRTGQLKFPASPNYKADERVRDFPPLIGEDDQESGSGRVPPF